MKRQRCVTIENGESIHVERTEKSVKDVHITIVSYCEKIKHRIVRCVAML